MHTEDLTQKCLIAAQIEMARLSRVGHDDDHDGFTAAEWVRLQGLPAICRPATTEVSYRELVRGAEYDLRIDDLSTLPGLARVLGYHLQQSHTTPASAAYGSVVMACQHPTVMQSYAALLLAESVGIPLVQPGQRLATRLILCDGTPVLARREPTIRRVIYGVEPRTRW